MSAPVTASLLLSPLGDLSILLKPLSSFRLSAVCQRAPEQTPLVTLVVAGQDPQPVPLSGLRSQLMNSLWWTGNITDLRPPVQQSVVLSVRVARSWD